MSGICYLAAPIDHAHGNAEVVKSRKVAAKMLFQHDWSVYDPLAAFAVVGSPNGGLQQINTAAVVSADALLALLPDDVATIGVPMEIQAAIMANRVVAVVGGERVMNSWALAHVNRFDDIADAVWFLTEEHGRRTKGGEARDEKSELGFFRERGTARIPTRAYDDDAGFDLYVAERTRLGPGEFADVPAGVSVELPSHCWGMIVGRSSTWRKRRLAVIQGIIDTGYRGELFAGVQNVGKDEVTIEVGERIAQLLLIYHASRNFAPVAIEEIAISERGGNGFGSSGT